MQRDVSGLSGITKIDLSDFDSSIVTKTAKMFANSDSLSSINFGKFQNWISYWNDSNVL